MTPEDDSWKPGEWVDDLHRDGGWFAAGRPTMNGKLSKAVRTRMPRISAGYPTTGSKE